jgi:hypothetical protein
MHRQQPIPSRHRLERLLKDDDVEIAPDGKAEFFVDADGG